ncbi:MAG TPA: hypothetical protein VHM70_15570 [Polyangiaceae bacterium]|jgi:hypothetical protein|nr:hypothetical protein [Polyangiaceae bacterium]
MNVEGLMGAIVRQTTVLLASLATADRGRAQLAHTANQVFLNLVQELKHQGLSAKVIADMFGLALRTYHDRVRRLSESRTVRGRSLWEAILEHIQERGPCSRAEVLARFAYDDASSVRGVLQDLVQSGSVYRTGRGESVTYRVVDTRDLGNSEQALESRLNLVWIATQRLGGATLDQLMTELQMERRELEAALLEAVRRGYLTVAGRRSENQSFDRSTRFESNGCVLAYENENGWEAALFDHYQALVGAICNKLQQGQTHARERDVVGGSTFRMSVWPGHPHYEECLGLLAAWRRQGSALREKVRLYNESNTVDVNTKSRVVAYVGQYVVEPLETSDD